MEGNMKILITIPETEYKRYKFKSFETITFAEDAIANGVVIQEGELAENNTVLAFSNGELEAIADALEYLLGAELLPENGFTDDVVSAINSAFDKVQEARSSEVD